MPKTKKSKKTSTPSGKHPSWNTTDDTSMWMTNRRRWQLICLSPVSRQILTKSVSTKVGPRFSCSRRCRKCSYRRVDLNWSIPIWPLTRVKWLLWMRCWRRCMSTTITKTPFVALRSASSCLLSATRKFQLRPTLGILKVGRSKTMKVTAISSTVWFLALNAKVWRNLAELLQKKEQRFSGRRRGRQRWMEKGDFLLGEERRVFVFLVI